MDEGEVDRVRANAKSGDQQAIDMLYDAIKQAASVEASLRREAHKKVDVMQYEIDRLRKFLGDHVWVCRYRNSSMGGNDLQECAWPQCGCDPCANRVIEHLEECGFEIVPEVSGFCEISGARLGGSAVAADDQNRPVRVGGAKVQSCGIVRIHTDEITRLINEAVAERLKEEQMLNALEIATRKVEFDRVMDDLDRAMVSNAELTNAVNVMRELITKLRNGTVLHAWEELGVMSYHDPFDTCGKQECVRVAHDVQQQEREEAHERLDRDLGW